MVQSEEKKLRKLNHRKTQNIGLQHTTVDIIYNTPVITVQRSQSVQ